jgi:putative ABC transport system permease protein
LKPAGLTVRFADLLEFAWRVVRGYRARTVLIFLAMGVGVAAVVAVSSIGEGARLYVVNQFGSLGTHLVVVLPGRSETAGAMPGVLMGRTPRDLTLDDALALKRSPAVRRIAPLIIGAGEVRVGARIREGPVLGSTAELVAIRNMALAQGLFLPEGDPHHAEPVCVIGSKLARELFPGRAALGEWLRIGDRRFRVVGVLASSGVGLGMNTDEIAFVPVSIGLQMLDTNSLFRVLVEARHRGALDAAKAQTREVIKARHDGEEDVTVITQDAVLATFDRVLGTLTLGVAGIAAISLAVAGILVMNVMLVSVTQRTPEIGLLKALGATAGTIRAAFLAEAALLSAAGGVAGFAIGQAGAWAIRQFYPAYPAFPPDWAVAAGLGTALLTGIVFGVLPARRAARLDPVQALARR